jgi:hypothetical protein
MYSVTFTILLSNYIPASRATPTTIPVCACSTGSLIVLGSISPYPDPKQPEQWFYMNDYAPNSYYEIGDDVGFNVYIKTYKRKHGEPYYTLNIQ